jgi:hypothetical protein
MIQIEDSFKFCTECGKKLTIINKNLSQSKCYEKLTVTNKDLSTRPFFSKSRDSSENPILNWNDLEAPLLSPVDDKVEKHCSLKREERDHLISDLIFSITRIRIRDT